MRRILLAVLFLLIPASVLAQPLWSTGRDGLTVDQAVLDDIFAKSAGVFALDLEGRTLEVEVQKVSGPNLGVSSLRGTFKGQPESFFLLCRGKNNATVAFFQPGDGTAYRLDHTSGRDAIRPVDEEKLGPCGAENGLEIHPVITREHHPPAQPVTKGNREPGVADDGSRHDIIIGYTPRAEEYMGGYDFIMAEAQLAVDGANLTYDNSLINSQLRLVHTMPTDYDEITAWDYGDHIEFLYYIADGHMDDMLVMRDRVGADFVSVFIDGRDFMGDVPYCGEAPIMGEEWLIPEFEERALSIVSVQCATSVWTLAHEVGHNRGCAHDRVNATYDGAYPYSYGLRFYYDPDTDFGLRTVMAYDHVDGGFTRVPHFSNPDVSYAGHPTGIAPGLFNESHNTLTHENTSSLCAAFRSERIFVEFGNTGYVDGSVLFPLPSIAQAIIGSREGAHIVLDNGDTGFTGILMDPRSYVHDGTDSAVLGGN